MPKNTNKTNKTNPKPTPKTLKTNLVKATQNDLQKDIRTIPIDEWDWDRIGCSEPVKSALPDGSVSYGRVWINYKYDEKTIGPAIIELGKKYSFGVQPNNVDKDGKTLK